jgi:peptide subunit release factor 1 (eRF1)
MLGREDLERLEALDGRGTHILSVYLDLDPARQLRRTYQIAFEDLVKEVRESLTAPARGELSREVAKVTAWLENEKPRGVGLALFSSAPLRLWQAHFLAVRVQDHLAFEPRADVAPLLRIADDFERYAVALCDKQKARLFTVFMGEIEESESFRDFAPPKTARGGISHANYERHREAHVHRHLDRIAHALAELARRRAFDRLILGGTEEAASELRRMLPRALERRVVAVLRVPLEASPKEVLEKTLEVEGGVEREFEARLVERLIESARSGGRASCGIEPTLAALWAGEIQTLVSADGVQMAGSECESCGRLCRGSPASCPTCGGALRALHDLFHRAMGLALEQSARGEVVRGDAARRLVEAGEGLGALLRFSPKP